MEFKTDKLKHLLSYLHSLTSKIHFSRGGAPAKLTLQKRIKFLKSVAFKFSLFFLIVSTSQFFSFLFFFTLKISRMEMV